MLIQDIFFLFDNIFKKKKVILRSFAFLEF